MATIFNDKPSTGDTLGFVILGMIFIAFLISIPFMVMDKNKRDAESWKNQGCQMYDNKTIDTIPVKCHNEFVDHYKSQEQREQPNE